MFRHRILLVDDHARIVERAACLLGSDFEIVGTAADGQSALEAAARLHPDLVVLDISMPAVNGIKAAALMAEWPAPPRVVFLTVDADPDFVEAARTVGACGYVLKGSMGIDLLPAVRSALDTSPECRGAQVWPDHHDKH